MSAANDDWKETRIHQRRSRRVDDGAGGRRLHATISLV